MNPDVRHGLVLLGSTLVAALFIAATWFDPSLATSTSLSLDGTILAGWCIVNVLDQSMR